MSAQAALAHAAREKRKIESKLDSNKKFTKTSAQEPAISPPAQAAEEKPRAQSEAPQESAPATPPSTGYATGVKPKAKNKPKPAAPKAQPISKDTKTKAQAQPTAKKPKKRKPQGQATDQPQSEAEFDAFVDSEDTVRQIDAELQAAEEAPSRRMSLEILQDQMLAVQATLAAVLERLPPQPNADIVTKHATQHAPLTPAPGPGMSGTPHTCPSPTSATPLRSTPQSLPIREWVETHHNVFMNLNMLRPTNELFAINEISKKQESKAEGRIASALRAVVLEDPWDATNYTMRVVALSNYATTMGHSRPEAGQRIASHSGHVDRLFQSSPHSLLWAQYDEGQRMLWARDVNHDLSIFNVELVTRLNVELTSKLAARGQPRGQKGATEDSETPKTPKTPSKGIKPPASPAARPARSSTPSSVNHKTDKPCKFFNSKGGCDRSAAECYHAHVCRACRLDTHAVGSPLCKK